MDLDLFVAVSTGAARAITGLGDVEGVNAFGVGNVRVTAGGTRVLTVLLVCLTSSADVALAALAALALTLVKAELIGTAAGTPIETIEERKATAVGGGGGEKVCLTGTGKTIIDAILVVGGSPERTSADCAICASIRAPAFLSLSRSLSSFFKALVVNAAS